MGLWRSWLRGLFEFSCVREMDSPPENSSPRNSWLTVTVELEWQSKVVYFCSILKKLKVVCSDVVSKQVEVFTTNPN
jgi:hypothetical protein